nr:class I SAM-dependent methyltransferase [Parvularcula maris]
MRGLGLLGVAERIAIARDVEEAEEANAAFLASYEGPPLPSASLIRRTYGDAGLEDYRNWGRENAAEIEAALSRHVNLSTAKVAEWGCGLGRLAMHLAPKTDYTGFDIDESSLAYCRAHLPGTYLRNDPMPPLPAEDASFDAVFAVSIFTHLSKAQHSAWAAEIRRVLKPGGVFLFTVHGEEQAGGLLPGERAAFDRGELVTRGGVSRGSRTYLAYHPETFVREVLLEGYEPVDGPEPCCGQTLYVGRKPY